MQFLYIEGSGLWPILAQFSETKGLGRTSYYKRTQSAELPKHGKQAGPINQSHVTRNFKKRRWVSV